MKKRMISLLLMTSVILSACSGKSTEPVNPAENINAEPEVIETEDHIHTFDAYGEVFEEDAFEAKVPKSSTPGEKEQSVSEEEMDSFLDVLLTKTNADPTDVRCCALDDFDGNGTYEGFMYVGAGPDEEFGWCEGKVYYVTGEKCDEVYSGTLAERDGNVFRVIDAGERKFILFDEAYVTALVTYVYYVENSKIRESNISRFGSIGSDTDLQNIEMSFSTYDGFCTYVDGDDESAEWTGHTWKPYYFYYDSDKKDFMEYGGSEISEDELAEIVGFDLAGEIRKEGYEVDNILRRKNGIININYSSQEVLEDGTIDVTYKNATYNENTGTFADAWDTGGDTWQDSDFGGIYMNCLNCDMAVY